MNDQEIHNYSTLTLDCLTKYLIIFEGNIESGCSFIVKAVGLVHNFINISLYYINLK